MKLKKKIALFLVGLQIFSSVPHIAFAQELLPEDSLQEEVLLLEEQGIEPIVIETEEDPIIHPISDPGVTYAPPDPKEPRPTSPPPADPKAFMQNFKVDESISLFSGSLGYRYPIWIPSGRLGIEPKIALQYSNLDTRLTTAIGHGWSLPTNGIYRTPKKGKDTTFTSGQFTVDIFGDAQELSLVNATTGEYYAKNESSFTRFQFKNNQWVATDKKGVKYTFGSQLASRQTDPKDANKIYKWMLERVQDVHGNFMTFTYTKDGGAIYPNIIRYTGHGSKAGIFEIRFKLKSRPTYGSYATSFLVNHQKLIGEIQIYNVAGTSAKKILTYKLDHLTKNSAYTLLSKVTMTSADGKTLPPTKFDYYPGGSGAKIYALKSIDEPYGANHQFVYQPSTAYRKANGTSQNFIPFVVHTVKEYHVKPSPTGPTYKTHYYYKNGRYYVDKRDAFNREYAGFGEVEVVGADGNLSKHYYHQSENDPLNANHDLLGEYNDHIAKKGKKYREEIWQGKNKRLQTTINRWDHKVLPAATGWNRTFAFLDTEVIISEEGQGFSGARSTAVEHLYDAYGNETIRSDFGEVEVANNHGGFIDIGADLVTTSTSYINDVNKYLIGFPLTHVVTDQSNKVLLGQLYHYDELPVGQILKGNQTKVQVSDGVGYLDTSMQYDNRGLLIKVTDPMGHSVSKAYDVYGLYEAKITNAKGHVTAYDHDVNFGLVTKVTNPNQISRYSEYDGFGRMIAERNEIKGVKNIVNSYSYQLSSYPFSMIKKSYSGLPTSANAFIRVLYTYYDGLHRPIQNRVLAEDSRSGYIVSGKSYDEKGRLKKQFLPTFESGSAFKALITSGVGTEYHYDALDRPTEVKDAVGSMKSTYLPWKKEVVDPLNNKKEFTNDARSHLIEVKEYLSGKAYSTYYTYDSAGNLIQLKNAKGSLKKMTYDPLHRRISMTLWHKANNTSPKKWQWAYDKNSNITSKIDPRGKKLTYTYDSLNRVLTEKGLNSTFLTYVYDTAVKGIGLLATVKSSDFTKSFVYQELGLPSQISVGIKSKTYKTKYEYNWLGDLIKTTHPNQEVIHHQFDKSGRIESIKNGASTPQAYVSKIEYSPTEALLNYMSGNQVKTANVYDINQMYRLTQKRSTAQSGSHQILQDFYYTFDKVGNLTKIEDKGLTKAAYTADYVYDDLYRMTQQSLKLGQNLPVVSRFSYDIVGNMLSAEGVSYAYANAHPQAVTTIGSRSFQYDAGGNLTSGDGWVHLYNDKNQLIKSTKGLDVLEYVYDELGDRLYKKEVVSSATNESYYPFKAYEEDGVTQRVRLFLKNEKVATVQVDPAQKTRVVYWNHSDHLGSANIATNAQMKIVEESAYTAYGKATVENTYLGYKNDYKYTGKEEDGGTNFHYYGARYYDADMRRFTSVDPLVMGQSSTKKLEELLVDPQQLNAYSYARNNPIIYLDPNGEWVHVVAGAAIGGIAGVVSQGIEDVLSGEVSNFSSYAGAAAGGAVSGAGIAFFAPASVVGAVAIGAASGVTDTSVSQTIEVVFNGKEFDKAQAIKDVATNAIGAAIPGPKFSPVNVGKGSFSAVKSQILTKLKKPSISIMGIKAKTAAKMVTVDVVEGAATTAMGVVDRWTSEIQSKAASAIAKKLKKLKDK